MQVPRRIFVTCLVGVVGVSALPSGTAALASYTGPSSGAVAAANAAPTLAASLAQLRAEVNARWPGRSRASDGWWGDERHQQNQSDHNPVGSANGPSLGTRGSVHALDITSAGIDSSALVGAIIGDSRLWYVIYNGTIWSRTYNWIPRTYYGDAHTTHVHISLRDDSQGKAVAAERDTRAWLGKLSSVAGGTGQVRALQQALINLGYPIPAGATGTFGNQTKTAVAAFQRAQGWSGSGANGIPGPVTLARLGVGAAAPAPAPAPVKVIPAALTVSSAFGSYVPGARGPHIVAMQKALIARGISIPAGATGLYGGQTKTAVAAFQRAQGWRGSGADGVPGAKTLVALGISGAPAAAPTVTIKTVSVARTVAAPASGAYAPGVRGAHIVAMQKALIARGISIPSGATGLYGGETRKAVAAFQRAQGWSGSGADGVPGKVTLQRLGLA